MVRWCRRRNETLGTSGSIWGRGGRLKECLTRQLSRRRRRTKEEWWEEVGAEGGAEENNIEEEA